MVGCISYFGSDLPAKAGSHECPNNIRGAEQYPWLPTFRWLPPSVASAFRWLRLRWLPPSGGRFVFRYPLTAVTLLLYSETNVTRSSALPRPRTEPVPATKPKPSARRWLLFVHQLPSNPSNLRVRTWRRLQQLGAIPLKQAVYVLPDTTGAREDFEWLKTEVKATGGDASVFTADNVDAWSDDALVEEFRRSRQDAYADLARDVEKAVKRASGGRRPRGTRAPAVRRLLDIFRERLTTIEGIDFFGSAGRDRVITLLDQLESRAFDATGSPASAGSGAATSYQARLWITRPRPGVDRMASAWLIRRFIDPQARFGFAADRQAVPEDGVPFDMFGVDFSHQGDHCTFETLCAVFDIRQPAHLTNRRRRARPRSQRRTVRRSRGGDGGGHGRGPSARVPRR